MKFFPRTAAFKWRMASLAAFLVPKFHLGTSLDPREISFRAGIGNEIASAIAFPNSCGGQQFWKRGALAAIAFAPFCVGTLFAAPPKADEPPPVLQPVTFHGHAYTTCTVNPKENDIRIFYKDDNGNLLKDFPAVDKYVQSHHGKLLFAANAGMFEPDMRPVGLLLMNKNEVAPINLKDAQGNFYMKPNGVFEINEKGEAHVIESSEYAALLTPAVWATQSGPLMVHGGDIHPDFNADSKNLQYRSGVGVRKDGIVVFAISSGPVNFYDFASFFLNKLKCPNALYLDGNISSFWVPGGKPQPGHTFGPILGITEGLD